MPCGGIYPISDANPSWLCFYCNETGCDHFCEEWDCGLHGACVVPFLHTEEGELVLDHKHAIQVDECVLQCEEGELMDPDETLKQLRAALADLTEEPTPMKADLVCELFENLDGWFKLGGYLPADWKRDGG